MVKNRDELMTGEVFRVVEDAFVSWQDSGFEAVEVSEGDNWVWVWVWDEDGNENVVTMARRPGGMWTVTGVVPS